MGEKLNFKNPQYSIFFLIERDNIKESIGYINKLYLIQ